jgi:hypothetical protein
MEIIMNIDLKPAITEEEKRLLEVIEESVRSLNAKGWRVANDEFSEKRFMNGDDILHSLKLELRKGPMMMDGC